MILFYYLLNPTLDLIPLLEFLEYQLYKLIHGLYYVVNLFFVLISLSQNYIVPHNFHLQRRINMK